MKDLGLIAQACEAEVPLKIEVRAPVEPIRWLSLNRAWLMARLQQAGALLLHGLDVDSAQKFEAAVKAVIEAPLEYTYRSTPRTRLGTGIYSATEYPAHQSIPLHNENAYQRSWPMLLLLCCVQPAAHGGETPLACVRSVTSRIDPEVRREFGARKLMYVRHYGTGVDLDWPVVFQTQDRREVERFCRANDIDFEWLPTGVLRTRQICDALAIHPGSGETLWFNQAHLFHPSSLDDTTRRALLSLFSESELPRNVFYGDGGRIQDEVLRHIRQCYDAQARDLVWQRGNLLLLDNMLTAHGRKTYAGARSVLVSMGQPSA